jgi:hypothetical protein
MKSVSLGVLMTFLVMATTSGAVACRGDLLPIGETSADSGPSPVLASSDGGDSGMSSKTGPDSGPGVGLDDSGPSSCPTPEPIQFPAFFRIADTYPDPPFDVCFPPVASSDDFTCAKPAVGGAGISTGTTTPYIAVPPYTQYMRFVAAGATDCSTEVGVRLGDDIGAFEATAGRYYTVHVDESGYDYDNISIDPAPTDAGPSDDGGPPADAGPSGDAG